MFRRLILGSLFCFAFALSGTAEAPCCGPITPAGKRLLAVQDGMNVESLWLAQEHVNWETGEPDKDADYEGPGKSTHCSAFAAAVGKKLGVYMLRPPEHGQVLLASAQARWFHSQEGSAAGWRGARDAKEAQRLANKGAFVVVGVQRALTPTSQDTIAIVRPSIKSSGELAEDGPGSHPGGATQSQQYFREVRISLSCGSVARWRAVKGITYTSSNKETLSKNTARPETDDKPRSSVPRQKSNTVGQGHRLAWPVGGDGFLPALSVFHRLWWPIFGHPNRRQKPIVCPTSLRLYATA